MCKQQIFRLGKLPQIIYATGIFLLPVSSHLFPICRWEQSWHSSSQQQEDSERETFKWCYLLCSSTTNAWEFTVQVKNLCTLC